MDENKRKLEKLWEELEDAMSEYDAFIDKASNVSTKNKTNELVTGYDADSDYTVYLTDEEYQNFIKIKDILHDAEYEYGKELEKYEKE